MVVVVYPLKNNWIAVLATSHTLTLPTLTGMTVSPNARVPGIAKTLQMAVALAAWHTNVRVVSLVESTQTHVRACVCHAMKV